jgi:hypothetical protein
MRLYIENLFCEAVAFGGKRFHLGRPCLDHGKFGQYEKSVEQKQKKGKK